MKIISKFLFFAFALALLACGNNDTPEREEVRRYDPVSVTKTNPMRLWMHYMPWFETPETNPLYPGQWGSHWTKGARNPNIILPDGRRQIASHFYPLIGPYASGDEAVIEYHLLLMKYSGVDGILIDWYGTRNHFNYAGIRANTQAIVRVLDRVGLQFAIVYEDRTLIHGLPQNDRVPQGMRDMQYIQTHFFSRPNYIRIDGRPLLLNFGPITAAYLTPRDWTRMFSVFRPENRPIFMTLYGHSHIVNDANNHNAQGEFIWVDATDMQVKYDAVRRFEHWIGGAYPGYKDYYEQAGSEASPLAPICHQGGALFSQMLELARQNNAEHLQLITWNDFGEGTMIEPTREFGFRFLNDLQTFSGVTYRTDVLESIYDYFRLRQRFRGNREVERELLQAFYYFVSLQERRAMEIVERLNRR